MQSDRPYIDFRRPRRVADTINATFYFLREEFGSLAKAMLYIAGPLLLLAAIFHSIEHEVMFEMGGGEGAGSVTSIVFALLAVLGAYFVVTLVSYAYAMRYANERRGGLTPGEVWQRVLSDAGLYITTILWSALVVIVPAVIVIVPFLGALVWLALLIYIGPVLLLVYPARFDRREGFWKAFSRIRSTIRGSWVSTFGLMIVTTVIVSLTGLGFGIASEALYVFVMGLGGEGIAAALGIFLASVINFIWFPLYAIAAVAFVIYYFGLVEDQEAVGLEAQVEAMAATELGPPDEPLSRPAPAPGDSTSQERDGF